MANNRTQLFLSPRITIVQTKFQHFLIGKIFSLLPTTNFAFVDYLREFWTEYLYNPEALLVALFVDIFGGQKSELLIRDHDDVIYILKQQNRMQCMNED